MNAIWIIILYEKSTTPSITSMEQGFRMATVKTDDEAELYYEFHENSRANDTLILSTADALILRIGAINSMNSPKTIEFF